MKVKVTSDVVCEDKGVTYNVVHAYGKKTGDEAPPNVQDPWLKVDVLKAGRKVDARDRR